MIREKILLLTREEVPHSIAVITDKMSRDEETGKIHIMATIIVERKSQKGIVLGKGGDMIRKIGKMARRDIEVMLGDKVYLETWVKVKNDWRDRKMDLADFGYKKKTIICNNEWREIVIFFNFYEKIVFFANLLNFPHKYMFSVIFCDIIGELNLI